MALMQQAKVKPDPLVPVLRYGAQRATRYAMRQLATARRERTDNE